MERIISTETIETQVFRFGAPEILKILQDYVLTYNGIEIGQFKSAQFDVSCGTVNGARVIFEYKSFSMDEKRE